MNKKVLICVFIITGINLLEVPSLCENEIIGLVMYENEVTVFLLNKEVSDLLKEMLFRRDVMYLYYDFFTEIKGYGEKQ